MAKDVKVTIELSKAVGSIGMGFPLVLGGLINETVEGGEENFALEYKECYSITDISSNETANGNIINLANAIFAQEHRPQKIAVVSEGDGGLLETVKAHISKGWRQLVVDYTLLANNTAFVALADYIETTDKMLFVSVNKTQFTALTEAHNGKKYKRTVICVNAGNMAAALVGETAGRTVGSFTYKFKTLKGITPEIYTDSELEAIHNAGGIAYVTRAGDDITTEGFATDGTYIDETDSLDYVIQNIEYRIQKTLNTTAKVAYDDRGIALIEAAVKTALQEAGVNGIIAQLEDGSYDYTVSFGARSATTEADRASRVYKYGTFRFSLAGAIHNVEVTGVVTA